MKDYGFSMKFNPETGLVINTLGSNGVWEDVPVRFSNVNGLYIRNYDPENVSFNDEGCEDVYCIVTLKNGQTIKDTDGVSHNSIVGKAMFDLEYWQEFDSLDISGVIVDAHDVSSVYEITKDVYDNISGDVHFKL